MSCLRCHVVSHAFRCGLLWYRELVTRKCPFEAMNPIQIAMGVLNHGLRETIPDSTPPRYAALIRQCWAADPGERPDFLEVLEVLESLAA